MLSIDNKAIDKAIILTSIMLMAMNFQSKFFYFSYGIFAWVCISRRRLTIPNSLFPYIFTTLVISFTHSKNGMLAALRPFSYAMMYCAGYNIVAEVNQTDLVDGTIKAECRMLDFILAMSLGSFLHLALNLWRNLGVNIGRNMYDIWTNQIMSATQQAALGCLMVGYSVYLIFASKTRSGRFCGWAAAILILFYNLMLAGRTIVAIYLVLFCFCVLYVFSLEQSKTKKQKVIYGIIFSVSILAVIYTQNLFGFQDIIRKSNLYERFFVSTDLELLDTGRSDAKKSYLLNMFRYPFGGLNLRKEFGYAHDLILDAYDEFGVLCAALLIFIIYKTLSNMWSVIIRHRDKYTFQLRICLICLYSAVHIEFFMEPIFAGMPWLFACYSLMNGCLEAVINNKTVYT